MGKISERKKQIMTQTAVNLLFLTVGVGIGILAMFVVAMVVI